MQSVGKSHVAVRYMLGDTCVRTGAFSSATWPGQALARNHGRPALIPGIQAAVWAGAPRRVGVWNLFVSEPDRTQRVHASYRLNYNTQRIA